jgi:small multidrug resistance pump
MGWVYLVVAIALEVSGTTCMKLSDGFTRVVPSVLMFVFYLLSISSIAVALKTIGVGVAYAIWSGLGTALIAAIGIFAFREPVTALKLFSIALIIAGVVGLNLGGGGH